MVRDNTWLEAYDALMEVISIVEYMKFSEGGNTATLEENLDVIRGYLQKGDE